MSRKLVMYFFHAQESGKIMYCAKAASSFYLISSILHSDHAFPIAFCLVMGAWSDKHGRKPLLLSSQVKWKVGKFLKVALLNQMGCSVPRLLRNEKVNKNHVVPFQKVNKNHVVNFKKVNKNYMVNFEKKN